MIHLTGPAWPTVRQLARQLRQSDVDGTYHIGGPGTDSDYQLAAFRAAGLRTPEYTINLPQARAWVEEGSIVFGRMLLHTRGNDICLPGARNLRGHYSRRWEGSEWWSRYIPPTEEWRIHVFDGRVIARGKKIQTSPPHRDAPVRNINNGWTFDFRSDPPEGIRRVARQAVEALGYPAGAVDILQVDTNDPTAPEGVRREFYVLEVNRVPALTCPYTLGAWASAIERYLGGEE